MKNSDVEKSLREISGASPSEVRDAQRVTQRLTNAAIANFNARRQLIMVSGAPKVELAESTLAATPFRQPTVTATGVGDTLPSTSGVPFILRICVAGIAEDLSIPGATIV